MRWISDEGGVGGEGMFGEGRISFLRVATQKGSFGCGTVAGLTMDTDDAACLDTYADGGR